jgi:hypothetical protein
MCQGLTNALSVITGEQGSGVAVLRHLVSRLRLLDRTPGVARVRRASRGLLRMRRVEAVQEDGGQVAGQQESVLAASTWSSWRRWRQDAGGHAIPKEPSVPA